MASKEVIGTYKGVTHKWVENPEPHEWQQAWVSRCGNPMLITSEPPPKGKTPAEGEKIVNESHDERKKILEKNEEKRIRGETRPSEFDLVPPVAQPVVEYAQCGICFGLQK